MQPRVPVRPRGLILLSTDHCTLCDQALDMLLSMPELRGTPLDVVDVAHHDLLLERYGPQLPVLMSDGRELWWPFSPVEVIQLLTN